MKEFIEELKYNQNINLKKGLENRIDIDYVIERLEDIKKDMKELTVTEIDEKIIGTRSELMNYIRNEIANISRDNVFNDEENFARILVEYSNIYNKLVYDYLDNNTLLCLYENAMGELDIKEIEI